MRHLLAIGVVATTSDAATTWLAVRLAAVRPELTFVELNPVIASLLGSTGAVTALVLRAVVGVTLFGFLAWAARRSRFGLWPLGLAAALTCLVVAWNTQLLVAHV